MVVSQAPLQPFPNVNMVLMEYLSDMADWTDTAVPPDEVTTGLQINRVGGADDGITDFPRVEVRAFAPTYLEADELAELVRQKLLVLGGNAVMVGGKTVVVDFCQTDQPPEDAPYDNPDRVVVPAWYRLGLMRPRR